MNEYPNNLACKLVKLKFDRKFELSYWNESVYLYNEKECLGIFRIKTKNQNYGTDHL